MRRRIVLVTLASICLIATTQPATARHSWHGWHWQRWSNPHTVRLGDNVRGDWDTYLRTVASAWSASSVLNLEVVRGRTRRRACNPTRGRVEVCNARYGYTGWLGLATVWANGGHIRQAIVRMNETYLRGEYYHPYVRLHVLCEEVGHVLGLDHQGGKSCMNHTRGLYSRGYTRPNSHDYDQLEQIYRHRDRTTSGGLLRLRLLSGSDDHAHHAHAVPGAALSPPVTTAPPGTVIRTRVEGDEVVVNYLVPALRP